jgi:acyl carrier protein
MLEAQERWVEPRVRRCVCDVLGIERDQLCAECSLEQDLAVDSLDLVELTPALESEFDISVPESRSERVRTYGELVHLTTVLVTAREHRAPRRHGDDAVPTAIAAEVQVRVPAAAPEAEVARLDDALARARARRAGAPLPPGAAPPPPSLSALSRVAGSSRAARAGRRRR